MSPCRLNSVAREPMYLYTLATLAAAGSFAKEEGRSRVARRVWRRRVREVKSVNKLLGW